MRKCIVCVIIHLIFSAVFASGIQEAQALEISDHFNDGVIDSALWVTNAYHCGISAGSWQSSFTEGAGPGSYLEARVWGPTSGGTYGLETDVIGTNDFNTGDSWLVNFTWSTGRNGSDLHGDAFSISISDTLSPIQTDDGPYWISGYVARSEFTQLWHYTNQGVIAPAPNPPDTPSPSFSPQGWSIFFDPAGFASIYQAPNAGGAAYRTVALDTLDSWYLSFIMADFTSSGFGSGDTNFRLHDYSAVSMANPVPEPGTLCLLSLGLAGLVVRRSPVTKK